jgi:hypothetical protein
MTRRASDNRIENGQSQTFGPPWVRPVGRGLHALPTAWPETPKPESGASDHKTPF